MVFIHSPYPCLTVISTYPRHNYPSSVQCSHMHYKFPCHFLAHMRGIYSRSGEVTSFGLYKVDKGCYSDSDDHTGPNNTMSYM